MCCNNFRLFNLDIFINIWYIGQHISSTKIYCCVVTVLDDKDPQITLIGRLNKEVENYMCPFEYLNSVETISLYRLKLSFVLYLKKSCLNTVFSDQKNRVILILQAARSMMTMKTMGQ